MPPSAPLAIIGWLFCALLAWLAAKFYAKRLNLVLRGEGRVEISPWKPADLALAIPLILWFVLNIVGSFISPSKGVGVAELQHGVILFGVLIAGITVSLLISKRNPITIFGIDQQEGWSACAKGAGYLLASYPLIILASLIVPKLLNEKSAPQEPVRLFLESPDAGTAKWVIIAAVLVAPIAEELIFRGYIYGIAKRFLGTGPAILGCALLFGAVHLHLPALPALVLLAVCLTIAYEITGSLLVPMAMHALFNTLSLVALLYFPELAGV